MELVRILLLFFVKFPISSIIIFKKMNFQFYSLEFQGKSTVAVHTANALVDQGFKVLFWNFRISFFFFVWKKNI